MQLRVALFAITLALLGSLLAGCSSLPFFGKKETPAEEGAPKVPERKIFELKVDAPDNLRKLLSTYLDVARFQTLPETESIDDTELDRLVAAAPAQARSLLETEGYFNAQVRASLDHPASGLPVVTVHAAPGPRTTVKKWSVDVVGGLEQAVKADDEDAVVELASLRRRWPLKVGDPFRQPDWSDAKNGTIARLRADGYPAATWKDTEAKIDAPTNSASLSVTADSGPLFHLGPIKVEGLKRYDEDSVLKLSTFHAGEPYSEQLLTDFQERLQKIGLFEGASLEIDPDPAHADAAPVTVHVKELPLQQATAGIGYSANTGPRFTLEHTHRKPFGWHYVATNKFELGAQNKSWNGELLSHPLDNLYRNLIAGTVEHLDSADEIRRSWSARVGRTQDAVRFQRLYFAEVLHSRLDTAAGTEDSNAATLNYQWILRDIDSLLLPTKGITLSLQGAVGLAQGHQITPEGRIYGRGPFTRAYGRITWYRPVGSSWHLTLRTEAGQVFARSNVGIPDTLLFRAGGDDSVRGYAYRTLGPIVNGVVTSGRVLWTGSAEIARPISSKYPQFWWAAFVDAGQSADMWSDLHPDVGYGVGLRWRGPVGPLRVDLAYGEAVRKWRLHLSMGITF